MLQQVRKSARIKETKSRELKVAKTKLEEINNYKSQSQNQS